MSSESFAHEWPGRRARHPKHEHPAQSWLMAKSRGKGGKHRLADFSPEEIADLIAARRMRGGPFGGPGGGGPFRGGPLGHGPRGRGRARRGDVRLALLRLLGEEPRNGYQLMQTIEERSGGEWRPSPGSVYPTLAQLEDEGLVRSAEADGARIFEITDAGREHLEGRSGEADPWELPEESGHSQRDVRRLIGSVAQAAMQVAIAGDERQQARAIELLTETRRSLYRLLAEDPGEPGSDDV